jgi:predicted ArsR family transcriptional regulator
MEAAGPSPSRDAVAALSALGDPVRRRLYDLVCSRDEPVGRDEAAARVGIARTLAAYHLDKLASQGLLTVAYERRSGRRGPGAGRPAKLYARSAREVSVSVPPRDYGLAAVLLADAAASDESGATERALTDAAGRLGRQMAADEAVTEDIRATLRERGYEPYEDADEPGVLRLRNCPFHAAAKRQPEVVCGMNLALLRGLLAGLGIPGLTATLEPGPGRCCVAIRRAVPDTAA